MTFFVGSLKLLEITQVLCLESVLIFMSFQEAMLSVIVWLVSFRAPSDFSSCS